MNKFELGYATKNYQIIYKEHQLLKYSEWLNPSQNEDLLKSRIDKFQKYCSYFPDAVNHNIWYDYKNEIFFSQAQYRHGPAGKDHHFNEDKLGFLKSREWGLDPVCNIVKSWGLYDSKKPKEVDQIFANDEIVYGMHEKIQLFRDKSVLIICGGPSVNAVSWERLNYDYIWSCNQFFMNERVAKHKIDLVTVVAGLYDYNNNEQFLKYIKDNDTLVSFEVERGSWETHSKEFQKTQEFCKNYKNSTFFHTRYRGQLGVGLRLIIYAAMLGFSDIYIVGLDGRFETEKDGNLLHAFETKKPVPNWYKRFGNDFQDRQMIIFWEYIMQLKEMYYPNMNIYNLGQDTEHNVLSRLFKDSYPLAQDIKERLNGTTY